MAKYLLNITTPDGRAGDTVSIRKLDPTQASYLDLGYMSALDSDGDPVALDDEGNEVHAPGSDPEPKGETAPDGSTVVDDESTTKGARSGGKGRS